MSGRDEVVRDEHECGWIYVVDVWVLGVLCESWMSSHDVIPLLC